MNSLFGQKQNGVMPQMPQMQPSGSNQFANFVNNFMKTFPNMSPQQIGMQLLNSGRMSQADFQAYSQIANRLTGRSK